MVSWERGFKQAFLLVSHFFFHLCFLPHLIFLAAARLFPGRRRVLNVPFGRHGQAMDIAMVEKRAGSAPMALFVHGGAWGSGAREHYSTFCSNLADHAKCSVASSSYRMWPKGLVKDMIVDVGEAVEACEPGAVVIGHSAGAHLVALAALSGLLHGKHRLVLLSGIYCVHSHYMFEAGRGVEKISPMERAMGGRGEFDRSSPLKLLGLEGAAGEAFRERARQFEWVLVHGDQDWTAPSWESERFLHALKAAGARARLVLLKDVGHSDLVMAVMRKSHKSAVLIKDAITSAAIGAWEEEK
jgi:acetyl esterase/lipase